METPGLGSTSYDSRVVIGERRRKVMGFVGQLLDLKKELGTNKEIVRAAAESVARRNKHIAAAVKDFKKNTKERDRALYEVIRNNPAAHAALVEALLLRRRGS
jgi:type IV secretory pathway VirD2 relaxase